MREKLALHDSGGFRAGKLGTRGFRRNASLKASWENVRLFGPRTPRRRAMIMQSRPFSRKKRRFCARPHRRAAQPDPAGVSRETPAMFPRAPTPVARPSPARSRPTPPVARVTTPAPASLVPWVSGFPLLASFASDPACPRARGARPCAGPHAFAPEPCDRATLPKGAANVSRETFARSLFQAPLRRAPRASAPFRAPHPAPGAGAPDSARRAPFPRTPSGGRAPALAIASSVGASDPACLRAALWIARRERPQKISS